MTAVEKVYYTRFVHDMLEHYIHCEDQGDPSHVPWLGVSVCVMICFLLSRHMSRQMFTQVFPFVSVWRATPPLTGIVFNVVISSCFIRAFDHYSVADAK